MTAPRRSLDLSLYLVVGPAETRSRSVTDVVVAAVAGGITAVQLRWKDGLGRAFVEQARALVAVLRPRGVPLIVNDRVDVALAAGADGVHVGQDDLQAADVRRLVGDTLRIGVSVSSIAEALAVDAALVDYAGVGPVFATTTKPDAAPPLGLEGARVMCDALHAREIPAVAIGGINVANAAEVLATGADGIAVVSAVCAAASPTRAAAALLDVLDVVRRAAVHT